MGRVIDIVPNRMLIAGLACAVMMAGHLLLGLTTFNPLVGLVTLSTAESVLPVILRASVPRAVPTRVARRALRTGCKPYGTVVCVHYASA